MFYTILTDIINETVETEVMPAVKPKINPTPTIKPAKPVNPIKPTPGVSPKPKALTNDFLLYISNRLLANGVSEMAFSASKFGDWVNKDKQYWIEHGDEIINSILPKIGTDEKTYLEFIASDNYDSLIKKIEKYLGKSMKKNTSLPSLVQLMMEVVSEIHQLESSHKKQLEQLALNTVLQLKEFELVKVAYENNDVEFDISLNQPSLSDFKIDNKPPAAGLSDAEETNLELAKALEGLDDSEFRRRFTNILITGTAINKMYLFEYVASELNKIDPKLVKLYGLASVFAELGYWVAPTNVENAAASNSAAGVSEVIPKGDIYVIKAKAINFPYLIHEIVKGIYEWILIDKDMQAAMNKETLGDETKDMLIGAVISTKIANLLTVEEQYLIPILYKKLAWLSPEQIKNILSNTADGKKILSTVINKSRQDYTEFKA